jgi:wobble nucleotide-excising tRNase
MLKYPSLLMDSIVDEDDDDNSKSNPEYMIERGKQYIQNGKMGSALYELDHIEVLAKNTTDVVVDHDHDQANDKIKLN